MAELRIQLHARELRLVPVRAGTVLVSLRSDVVIRRRPQALAEHTKVYSQRLACGHSFRFDEHGWIAVQAELATELLLIARPSTALRDVLQRTLRRLRLSRHALLSARV